MTLFKRTELATNSKSLQPSAELHSTWASDLQCKSSHDHHHANR